MLEIILAWAWQNRRVVAEIFGIVVLAIFLWWGFWYNPRKISELKAEKAELQAQLKASHAAVNLLTDIQNSRKGIDNAVQSQISTIRNTPRPHNRVIIPGGRVLPPLPSAGKASH